MSDDMFPGIRSMTLDELLEGLRQIGLKELTLTDRAGEPLMRVEVLARAGDEKKLSEGGNNPLEQ